MRTIIIITLALLPFLLVNGCKKKNNDHPTEPICHITRYQDYLTSFGVITREVYMQYNDDRIVLYTEGRHTYQLYYNTNNIVIKRLDSFFSDVRTDSMTLNDKGRVTAKYITFNDTNTFGYPSFFDYNAAGQPIRMIVAGPGTTRDTTLYEWEHEDIVRQIRPDDTQIFYYDNSRLASDGDPWFLAQKLEYGTQVLGSKHLRQSIEFRSSHGAWFQRYEYSYSKLYITGAKVIQPFRGSDTVRNIITYQYTCH